VSFPVVPGSGGQEVVVDLGFKPRALFPLPVPGRGYDVVHWILLGGNRTAVTVVLLSVTFTSILLLGTLWPFEMRNLLTETQAVQTILNTFMSGIILLVSIVVSINSIVLSYQITSLSVQRKRIEEGLEFRRQLAKLTATESGPTDPASFLRTMTTVIQDRAGQVAAEIGPVDAATAEMITDHLETVTATTEHLDRSIEDVSEAQFGQLWLGLETDYSGEMDRSRSIATTHANHISEGSKERLEDLIDAFELFAMGTEYFKTLYYSHEMSTLSRRLLVVSLPAILITASTILAINAGLFPDVWVFGLPPLVTFVATAFTIALSPYVVLTAHMLRLATVSLRTTSVGPLSLRS
jgi:hypothetical protein